MVTKFPPNSLYVTNPTTTQKTFKSTIMKFCVAQKYNDWNEHMRIGENKSTVKLRVKNRGLSINFFFFLILQGRVKNV